MVITVTSFRSWARELTGLVEVSCRVFTVNRHGADPGFLQNCHVQCAGKGKTEVTASFAAGQVGHAVSPPHCSVLMWVFVQSYLVNQNSRSWFRLCKLYIDCHIILYIICMYFCWMLLNTSSEVKRLCRTRSLNQQMFTKGWQVNGQFTCTGLSCSVSWRCSQFHTEWHLHCSVS